MNEERRQTVCGVCRAELRSVPGGTDFTGHGFGVCDRPKAVVASFVALTNEQKELLESWCGNNYVPHGHQVLVMAELHALGLVEPCYVDGSMYRLTALGLSKKLARQRENPDGNGPRIRGPDAPKPCDHPTNCLTTDVGRVKCKLCGWSCEGSTVIAQVVARLIGEAEAAEPGETLLSRKEAERLAKEVEASPKEPHWFEKRGITEGDWNQRCDEALAGKDAIAAQQPLLAENARLRRRLESLERKTKR